MAAPKNGPAAQFASQFLALCYKNAKLSIRRWNYFLFVIAWPLLIWLVALIVYLTADTHPPPESPLTLIPTYSPPKGSDYTGIFQLSYPIKAVAYIPPPEPELGAQTENVMHRVAARLGFPTSEFVEKFQRFDNLTAYAKHISVPQGANAFEFCVHFEAEGKSKYDRTVMVFTNNTLQKTWFTKNKNSLFSGDGLYEWSYGVRTVSQRLWALQVALNEALTAEVLDIPTANFSVAVNRIPDGGKGGVIHEQVSKQIVSTTYGSVFYQLSGLGFFMVVISSLMEERSSGLKNKLSVMGLSEGLYLISWALFEIPRASFALVLFTVAAMLSPMFIFSRTNPFVIFLVFLCYQWALFGLATTICAVCRHKTIIAFVIAMIILFVALIWEVNLDVFSALTYPSAPYSSSYYMWFDSTAKPAMLMLPFFFPFMGFGGCLAGINQVVSDNIVFTGRDFTFGDLYEEYGVTGRSPSWFLSTMIVSGFIWMFLGWYFGQIFNGETGNNQPLWFLFLPSFWRGQTTRRRKKTGNEEENSNTISKKQAKSAANKCIVIHKMSKVFKNKNALKELSIEMNHGEVFCLLGHNGAGKTTTINILTGIHAPTHGYAWIYGKSTQEDMDDLRHNFGICEQEDIVWKELSGYDHVFFYGMFRGLSMSQSKEAAGRELAEVMLSDAANQPCGTYSGGMRRRLSVAIACVGDPEVLFLDEPTTGMDPVSKKYVWDKILAYKQKHLVILTTHSMQEADVLSDNIAILADGRLRAHGSALFLKNHFGSGYKLHCICTDGKSTDLIASIQAKNPKIEVFAHNADDVTLRIPFRERHTIPVVIHLLHELGDDVIDWGLSNTTLEEVFLRVAVDSKAINAGGDEDEDELCRLCKTNLTELVTLYTAKRAQVDVAGIICQWCADEFDPADPSLPPSARLAIEGDDAENGDGGDRLLPESAGTGSGSINRTPPSRYNPSYLTSSKIDENIGIKEDTAGSYNEDAAPPQPSILGGITGLIRYKSIPKILGNKKILICLAVLQIIIVLLVSVLGAVLSLATGGSGDDIKCFFSDKNLHNHTNDAICNATHVAMYLEGSGDPMYGPAASGGGNCEYGCRTPYSQPYYTSCSFCAADFPSPSSSNPGRSANVWLTGLDSASFTLMNTTWPRHSFRTKSGNILSPTLIDGPTDPTVQCTNPDCVIDLLFARQMKRNQTWITNHQDDWVKLMDELTSQFPHHAVHFNKFDASSGTLDMNVTAWLPRNPIEDLEWYRNEPGSPKPTDANHRPPWAFTYFWNSTWQPNNTEDNTRYNAPMSMVLEQWTEWNGGLQVKTQLKSPQEYVLLSLNTATTNLWRQQVNMSTNSSGVKVDLDDINFNLWWVNVPQIDVKTSPLMSPQIILMICLVPIGTQLLLPLFVNEISGDVTSKSLVLTKIMGLKTWQYWAALWAFDMVMEVTLGFLYTIIILAVGVLPWESAGTLFLVMLAYGHSLVGLSIFLAGVISKVRIALIISFMWAIVAGPGLSMSVWVGVTLTEMPNFILFVPPMALSFCFLKLSVGEIGGQVLLAPVFLTISGTVLMLIGVFFYGIRTGLLREWLSCFIPSKNRKLVGYEQLPLTTDNINPQDSDVMQMKTEVDGIVETGTQNTKALVLQDLMKAFPKGGRTATASVGGKNRIQKKHFLAVKSVSWYANYGECFGLLGPNGAGKTTTMHMIEGSLQASAGRMFVNGLDNTEHPDQVHTMLGVCAQENILWDDLTVKHHLFLYSSIKGIPRSERKSHVQHIAEVVQLDGDEFNQSSKELSGGMKRRLCIGIALVGNPTVLLLDEPTTGLDPESRRVVWDVIHACRQRRCVVLTTHSMEEADALCNKIAIMANGQVQCVGSQLHLKNKFGSGYKLTVTVHAQQVEESTDFVTRTLGEVVFGQLRIISCVGTTTVYNLTGANLDVGAIFAAMDTQEIRRLVADWGFAMCSLDDVFISVVQAAEELPPSRATHGSTEQNGKTVHHCDAEDVENTNGGKIY